MQIISCSNYKSLGLKIAKLKKYKFIATDTKIFSANEYNVQVVDNIDPKQPIYIVQHIIKSANDALLELMITINELKVIGSKEINIIIPYMPYSRQDKPIEYNKSITLKFIAKLLEQTAINSIITLDLHQPNSTKFFNIPCVNIETSNFFSSFIAKNLDFKNKNTVIIAPDLGSYKRAYKVAEQLNLPYLIIKKNAIIIIW